jgi:hypothetical protein
MPPELSRFEPKRLRDGNADSFSMPGIDLKSARMCAHPEPVKRLTEEKTWSFQMRSTQNFTQKNSQ